MSDIGTAVVVEGHDETVDTIDLDRWCEVARSTLMAEGVDVGRLDLIFVDSANMAELNEEHMGHQGPTDVLAFPLDGPDAADLDPEPESTSVGDPSLHLGDVVVCAQVAADQASEHAGSIEAELTLLVVHGTLHVLGHDHAEPDETALMRGRERVHLQRYGLGHPEAV